MATFPRSTRDINKLLPKGYKLNKGKHYYYFTGEKTATWKETAIYVERIDQLTIEEWIKEFNKFKKEE